MTGRGLQIDAEVVRVVIVIWTIVEGGRVIAEVAIVVYVSNKVVTSLSEVTFVISALED